MAAPVHALDAIDTRDDGLPTVNVSLRRVVRILGTHGLPASYGGFETAAQNIALFLHDRGWRVIVYCQRTGDGPIHEDTWNDIELICIPVQQPGWRGTSIFDLKSIIHSCHHRDLCLTFGYNTAIFNVLHRLRGIPLIINMDGLEWSRARWGLPRQSILYLNERVGARLGNRLIADHPVIERHLQRRVSPRKIAMIAYGGIRIDSADPDLLKPFGLIPMTYVTSIGRPIPENSIREIVTAFSARRRHCNLVVLGEYTTADEYHQSVRAAASTEVKFIGAQYDPNVVQALRLYSLAYVHGHTVGGTNPSLVEAMGAGNPVIAHDNPYNRWVAGKAAVYFADTDSAAACFDTLLASPQTRAELSAHALERFATHFTWEKIGQQYEDLLISAIKEKAPA